VRGGKIGRKIFFVTKKRRRNYEKNFLLHILEFFFYISIHEKGSTEKRKIIFIAWKNRKADVADIFSLSLSREQASELIQGT
jgi:CRISPR-associated protein Cas8b1/Cst1 subtype I-B